MANNVGYFDTTVTGKNYYCYDYELGESALVGGSVSTDVSKYTGITSGGFDITINGTNHQVSGLNFSSAQTIWDVAVTLNSALNAVVSGTQATWMGSNFTLNTAASSTGISAAVSPTASGATDVSRTLGLSSGSGATVTKTYAFSNNSLCYAPDGPTLGWEFATGLSLSAWSSATGFDAASQVADPKFVNAATSGYDFHPATGSPLIGMGNGMYAPKVDITGSTRSGLPDIGAYQ